VTGLPAGVATLLRRPSVRRWWRYRSAALDVLVAVATTGVELGLLTDGSPGVTLRAVALTVLSGVLLIGRRRRPLLVLAGTVLLATVLVLTDDYPGGAPVVVALYTVADERGRRTSLAALVPTLLLLLFGSISSPPISIAAWGLGSYVRTRRRYTAALEERAAHLEREREQLDAAAAAQERALIARELHDVVAHSVTVMLLGVRGARDVLRTAPDVAEEVLRQVETGAEDSIAELRRILTVLRAPGEEARLRPAPGLAALTDLVQDWREAGLPVELRTTGPGRALPDGVQLSVYRIVEEALTNVLRHSPASRASVRLAFGEDQLEVTVEDDGGPGGRALPAAGAGHGLVGMHERAAAVGGQLSAGPRDDGGWQVRLLLPLREVA
jgi:signal transduction histidine kinase